MAGQDCAACGGSLHRPSSVQVDGQRYHERCAPISREDMKRQIGDLQSEVEGLKTELASRPTTWAYDAACAALKHWRAEAERIAELAGVEAVPPSIPNAR